VYSPTNYARVGVQVGYARHVGVVASVYAGRGGLQVQVAVGVINKERGVSDVTDTISGHRYRTTVIQRRTIVICSVVEINDAVVQRPARYRSAIERRR